VFPLGQMVATQGALDALEEADETIQEVLRRHAKGDWGDLSPEDRAENERGLKEGLRLLSAYTLSTGERLWIITEHDRSATTLLLPDEY
jgi:hypothetical protein